MKAIGYIRVSTAEQAREGVSLDQQASKIKAYADLNDFELIEIFSDRGKSGTNLSRPGIQKVISLCQKREIDAVIIYKLDRLSRNTVDNLTLIEMFESNSVSFHSITEKVDTESAIGKFFLTITAAYAQMERDLIAERTKDAMAFKRSKGEKTGGDVPFGFNCIDGVLEPNANERRVIGYIQELHSGGMSFSAIARDLNRKGFKTKTGKCWYPMQVSRMAA